MFFFFQEKLQNSFRMATSKISATIGLGLPREAEVEDPPPVDEVEEVTENGGLDVTTTFADADAVTDNDD